MTPLRTTVVMKTDISGSTRRFRELLAADLQALLGEHRILVARHAAEHSGRILKPAGDGYWLEFPSVTGAAQAAIAMQEALRLSQLNRGDDRLAIRIVIALGDMAVHDDDFIGEAFALATRIEAVTPPDAIYLTAAARLAQTSAAEIQTAFVETFDLKGFAEPVPVYRIEQRHRTRVLADVYILFSDLNGFGSIMDTGPTTTVERILDALDAVTYGTTQEFGGTVRFNSGDSYCMTFAEAGQAIAAAERLCRSWDATRRENSHEQFGCAISAGLHRGSLYAFRSFLYGRDVWAASKLQGATSRLLASDESGIFVTGATRDALFGTRWYNQLLAVALQPLPEALAGVRVYRLHSAASN